MTHHLHSLIPWLLRTATFTLVVVLWLIEAPALSLTLLAIVLMHMLGNTHRSEMAPRNTADSLTLAREAGR